MSRWVVALAVVMATGCAAPGGPLPLPSDVAVIGDSISRAMNLDESRSGDWPQSSWATGADPDDDVTSHLERLRALQPERSVVGFNDAQSGARIQHMRAQAEEAVKQGARYVVMILGANDACAASPARMTSEADYRADLRAGLDALAGLPKDAVVFLVSVPDVTHLLDVFADDESARAVWSAYGVCPSALAPDGDPHAVRVRIAGYNRALAEEAEARGHYWDGGRVFSIRLQKEDVSALDYFHPSAAGQARLAEQTWDAGPWGARAG